MNSIHAWAVILLAFAEAISGCEYPHDRNQKKSGLPQQSSTMQSRNPNRERADTAAFVYAPERQSRSGRAEGLEVVVKVEEAKPEGFFLDFYAIKSTDGGKKVERISLGGTTIFKPLSKGESMTVYLEPPPANAWIHSKRGDQLHLGFEVKAGHGERSVPDVELRIVDVHESSGK